MKKALILTLILLVLCTGMLMTSCLSPKHNPVVQKVVEPTCESVGYTEYYCKHCKGAFVADFKDALGHTFCEAVVVKPEDCTNRGIYERACASCGITEEYSVSAKGHSYVEITGDEETIFYECEHCYHTLTVGLDEDIEDYTGSVELFDVETSFTFDVLSNNGEVYIRENLVIIDNYFIGSEYENVAMIEYSLEKKENGLYTVSFPQGLEYDTTYIAKFSEGVRLADYKGIELFFTVKDDPHHENVQDYNGDIVFLHSLEKQNGGYYPYEVSAKEGESRIYVTVGKVDGLEKGQLICVGEVSNVSEITNDKTCYFGIIDELYESAEGKWVVALSAPELQDIYDDFDIAFNEEINLENADINIEQLKADLVDALYADEQFIEFLSVVKLSASEYLNANGYHSHNLDTIEKYLASVRIDPDVRFNKNKLVARLNGEIMLDIEDENGKGVGTLMVEFSFDIETQFKIDINYEIKNTALGGMNLDIDRFDIAITQSDTIGFDFGVSVDSETLGSIGYVKNKNTGEMHLDCCIEVVRAADPSIFAKASANEVSSANKKCSHCKPTGEESLSDTFNSYYVNTLYCSDWEKVTTDIEKLTKTDGAKADVKLTSVDIPVAMGVKIQLDLGFMLSLAPRAVLDYSCEFSQSNTYGMRLNHNHLQPYSKSNGGNFSQDNIAIVGKAQAKIGLSVDAFVSIKGCENWFRAGVAADIGAYSNMSGVYDSNESYSGAYLEAGTFIDVNAYYKLFAKGDSADVAEATYPMTKYGYEKLYFGYDNYYDTLNILGSYDIDANNLLDVRYIDLVNMTIKTDELSLNEKSKYRVDISLADGSYCELINGVIVYKTGAPEVFTDTLIITVTSGDDWNNYHKGSSVYYIGAYEIDFEFDTNHRHTWTDATCTTSKTCTGCGIKEGDPLGHTEVIDASIDATCTQTGLTEGVHCSVCNAVIKEQRTISALGHSWQSATCQDPKTCNRCETTEGTVIDCIESDWIIDKAPTETEEGSKHTECIMCGKVMSEGVLDSIGSAGLSFTLSSDKKSYSVSGKGTCTDTHIAIPSIYNDLPVTSIAYQAFRNCTSLASITIPDSVTSIGGCAFYKCTSLTSVIIPDSVTSIGDSVFYNCTSLTSITIPDSVTSIRYSAFSNCTSLTSVTIGNSVTSIGNYAFARCTSLTSITIPDSVTSVGGYAFLNCTSLTSITIGNSVTSIGNYAFSDCNSLTSITIGNSVTSIGGSAFYGCTSLTSIEVDENNEYYKSIDGNLYSKDGTTLIQYARGKQDASFAIPDSVTSIGSDAFFNCTSLASITIPDSVTSIGDYAFRYCTSLTSITIGNSVTSIGDGAFVGCTSLTSVIIPDSVRSIGECAFGACDSLTSVVIGNSVTSIGYSAFKCCTSLTSITIPDSVTSIDEEAFYGCTSLANVEMGDSVTSIGKEAFYRCISLTSITFEGTVEQWNAISLSTNWKYNVPATQIICSDGTVTLK